MKASVAAFLLFVFGSVQGDWALLSGDRSPAGSADERPVGGAGVSAGGGDKAILGGAEATGGLPTPAGEPGSTRKNSAPSGNVAWGFSEVRRPAPPYREDATRLPVHTTILSIRSTVLRI
jgi:hypothetical protein